MVSGAELEKIRGYIEDEFLVSFDDDLRADSDLFKEGVMDSFGYVQLCKFLETEFEIKISEPEMTGNILVSLSQMQAFVAGKTGE